MTMTKKMFTAEGKDHIEFPAELIEMGLEDYSWRNDGAAMSLKDLSGDRMLVVWVAEENVGDRENPEIARYYAYMATDGSASTPVDGGELYEGESLDELLAV